MSTKIERKFKAGIDKDDCRKNRADAKVQLRKASKEEGNMKRRNMTAVSAEIVVEEGAATDGPGVPELAQIVIGFCEANGPHELAEQCLDAVVRLRKMLSCPNNPPIDEVINAGTTPHLVMLLQHPMSKLQFESAWCLTNIASGNKEQCQAVVSHNAVPSLVTLIGSESVEVSEQVVWALGNIAGDCPRLRDHVLEHNAVPLFLALVERLASDGRISPLRNAVWALSNLVRGKPHVDFAKVEAIVRVLVRLLSIDDGAVRADACWAFSYLADCGNHVIDALARAGAAAGIVQLLSCGEPRVITPAMRAAANILTGTDTATQAVLDAGFLRALPALLMSPKMQLRKEVCWALSNVTAGTPAQLDEVMRTGLLELVVQRLDKDEFDVQKEAAWVIANVMHGYQTDPTLHAANRVRTLVQLGCIGPLVNMLDKNNPATQMLVLDALANQLSAGEELGKAKGENEFTKAFDEAEGVDKLEGLQEHNNADICDKVRAASP